MRLINFLKERKLVRPLLIIFIMVAINVAMYITDGNTLFMHNKENNSEATAVTTSYENDTSEQKVNDNNSNSIEYPKFHIGWSNIVILVVLLTVLAVRKYKDNNVAKQKEIKK